MLNQKSRKDAAIIFFDIDGTLMDEKESVPESAVRGIHEAQERGAYCFICTGRAFAMLPKPVTEIGFDGVICGGGTYLSIGERVVEERELTEAELQLSYDYLRRGNISFLYEGNQKLHVMPWDYYKNPEEFHKQLEFFRTPFEIIEDVKKVKTSKFSCHIAAGQWDYCRQMAEELKDYFQMIVHSVPADDTKSHALTEGFVEFLPKGYDKSVGIEKAVRELGLDRKNTYAFGDGSNDIGMLKLVAHPAAMGNACREAMTAAGYVTADLKEDGIYLGLQHFKLIG